MAQFLHIPVVDKQGIPDRNRYFRLRVGSKLYQQLEQMNDGKFPSGSLQIIKNDEYGFR